MYVHIYIYIYSTHICIHTRTHKVVLTCPPFQEPTIDYHSHHFVVGSSYTHPYTAEILGHLQQRSLWHCWVARCPRIPNVGTITDSIPCSSTRTDFAPWQARSPKYCQYSPIHALHGPYILCKGALKGTRSIMGTAAEGTSQRLRQSLPPRRRLVLLRKYIASFTINGTYIDAHASTFYIYIYVYVYTCRLYVYAYQHIPTWLLMNVICIHIYVDCLPL